MMLLLVPVVLLLQCCSSETQERAPLYVFEAEQDVNETYGATSGIATIVSAYLWCSGLSAGDFSPSVIV